MAISSPIKVINITKGFNSLRAGLGSVKKSAQGIKSILFNKTKVKQQAISGKKVLQNRRRENSLRKEQQDILEASGIKPTIRRTRTAIVDSSKGFLGRILDFVGTLFVGWLLYNLPTLITMTTNLITRIKTLFGALSGFIGNIFNVFGDIGNIIGGVLSNITHLDFLDSDRKVRGAFDDLTNHFDDMGKQFEDGVKSLTTPLGEGAGEEPIPSTGTVYTTPAGSMEGGSNEQKTMSFLISSGLTQSQAAGIAGNIQQESHFDPKADNGSHHGIAQWDKKDRWPRVAAYIKSIGKEPDSLEGQLYGLIWEAQARGDMRQIKATKSSEQASAKWLERFEISGEKPGQRGYENRMTNAARLEAKYKNYNPQAKFGQPNYSTTGAPISGKGSSVSEYITGDPNTSIGRFDKSGHGTTRNYHDHLAFKDKETTLKAYNFFKSKGFTVTELNVSTGHANGSLHYFGRAFDIPGAQWKGSGAIGAKEYQGSAKVRATLAEFLGSSAPLESSIAQVSAPPSAPPSGITPERRGSTVAVMDNRQPQQPTPSGGGGGGGSAPASIPSSDGLNSFIKQNLLLDLAYT